MITAQTIGTNGRLGNQMFQYAALHGIAKFHGFEYWSQGGRLFDVFEMGDAPREPKGKLPHRQIREETFEFDARYFTGMIDDVDLWGYFQRDKYWEFCKDDIKSMCRFKEPESEDYSSHCSLHIRRTDYLNSPEYHTNLGFDYYTRAIEELQPRKVMVFSDDPSWCKANIDKFLSNVDRVDFASDVCSNDIEELKAMTRCGSAIMANSTFSWWGAYLGPQQRGERVIAPRNWFGKLGPNSRDIYLESWTLI